MCINVFALKRHSRFKFILIANRDEFYLRQSLPLGFHHISNNIVSGIDLEKGGTWLGLSTLGKFAMITNHRNPLKINLEAPTRGNITLEFLAGKATPEEFISQLQNLSFNYNGYNLVVGDFLNDERLWHYSNVSNDRTEITDGIHGISNALLDTPWPKMIKLKNRLENVIENNEIETDSLLALLLDESKAETKDLPNTNVTADIEKLLSSIFIKSAGYGTICSTILLISHTNQVKIIEYTHPKGQGVTQKSEQVFRFLA